MPSRFKNLFLRLRQRIALAPLVFASGGGMTDVIGHVRTLRTIRGKLDPFKQGRSDAVRNDPRLRDGTTPKFEHDTAVAFQTAMDRLKRDAELRVGQIDVRIKRQPNRIAIEPDDILADADEAGRAVFASWQERLVRDRLSTLMNKRYLNAFRRANRVVRDAERKHVVIGGIGLTAAAAAESFLNYWYLATTGSASPVDTVVFVMATAMVNVVIGFASGMFGVRNLNHVNPARKAAGAVLVVACLALAVLLHWALANYRHAIDVALGDPTLKASASLMAQRMADIRTDVSVNVHASATAFLNDTNAVVVFGYGLVFNLFAVWDGATQFSDPYPGYGRCNEAHLRTLARSRASEAAFRKEVSGVVDRATASLDAAERGGRERHRAVKRCIDEAVNVMRRYEASATRLENTFLRMVADYRDEFRQVRETRGLQQWQDDHPRLDVVAPFDLDGFVQFEEREATELAALVDAVQATKARLRSQQTALVLRVEGFLTEVAAEAGQEDAAMAELVGARSVVVSA